MPIFDRPLDEAAVPLPQDPQPGPRPAGPVLDFAAASRQASRAEAFRKPPEPDLVETFRQLAPQDPSIEAEARAIARNFGADENTAVENIDVLRQLAAARAFKDRFLAERNPTLHAWLSKQEWARVARDDVDSLVEHDGIFSRWGRSLAAGWSQEDLDRVGVAASREADGMPTRLQQLRAENLAAKAARARAESPWMGPVLNVVGQMAASVPEAVGAGFAAGKLTTAATANPLAGATAATFVSAATLFGQVAYNGFGRKYLELVQTGVDPDTAFDIALGSGVVEGALETAGGFIASKAARALLRERALAKAGKAFDIPTTQEARAAFGWGWAKAAGGELGTETAQTLADRASTHLAWATLPEAKRKELEADQTPLVDEVLEVARDTLLAMLPLGAVAPAVKLYHDGRRVAKATADRANWDALAKAKEGSKIAQRPGVYPAHMEAQIQANGLPSVTALDARGVVDALKQADAESVQEAAAATGADPLSIALPFGEGPASKRFRELFPEQFSQLEDAAQNGDDVEIPTTAYGDKVVGSELHTRLVDHIRLDGDLTTAELRDARTNAPETVSQARADIRVELQKRATERQQLRAVIDDVKSELMAAGVRRQDSAAAQIQGELAAGFARLRAQADGVDVETWWKANKPTIVGERGDPKGYAAVMAKRVQALEQQVGNAAIGQGERGAYIPSLRTILLSRKANLSTFSHEMLHWHVETLLGVARSANATEATKADAKALLDRVGVASVEEWDALAPNEREMRHETLASWWERYLAEGKAPSIELQTVFSRIRDWMVRIYADVVAKINARFRAQFGKDLPELDDTTRAMFDRMIASQAEIAEMRVVRNATPIFQTQEESGMNDADWKDYQDRIADADKAAQAELDAQSVEDMQWLSSAKDRAVKKLQREHDRTRSRVREDVERDLLTQPVYRLVRWAQDGRLPTDPNGKKEKAHRISMDLVSLIVSPEEWDTLAKRWGVGTGGVFGREGGLETDVVAAKFGFGSGGEMVSALLKAQPFDEAVRAETDRRMIRDHSDLTDPKRRQEVVARALHSAARANVLAAEIRALESATRKQVGAADTQEGDRRSAAAKDKATAEAEVAALEQETADMRRVDDARPEVSALLVERNALQNEMRAARQKENFEALDRLDEELETLDGRLRAARSAPLLEAEDRLAAAKDRLREAERIASGKDTSDRIRIAAAKMAATEVVDATPWGELRSLIASADRGQVQAAREAERAIGAGKLADAVRAKNKQLRLHEIRRAAQEAVREQEKSLAAGKKMFGPNDRIAKKRSIELVEAGRAVLAAYGLAPKSQQQNAALDYVKRYFPARYDDVKEFIDHAEANGADFELLTVAQMRDMLQTVRALWDESKREKVLEIEGRKVALAEVGQGLRDSMARFDTGKVEEVQGQTTTWQKVRRNLSSLKAVWRRVEAWSQAMGTPWERDLVRPIIEKAQHARKLTVERTNRYIRRLDAIAKTLPAGKITAKDLGYEFGRSSGQGMIEVLGALMHVGNPSNYRKLLLGYGWGEKLEDGTIDDSRFRAFLADLWSRGVLKREHLEFVQSTWDLLGEILPDMQRSHRRIYGYFMDEVKSAPFSGPWGDILRGGYVPAKTDRTKVDPRMQRFESIEQLMADERNAMPAPRSGFRHSRVEGYAKPLNLSLNHIARHIGEATRFAELGPQIHDALAILNDNETATMLARIDPEADARMLRPWLQAIANDATEKPGLLPVVDTFWRKLRSRVGVLAMFGGVSNSLQQVTGFFPAVVKVPPARLLGALATWVRNPRDMHRRIAGQSELFALRSSDAGRMLRTRLHEIEDGTGVVGRWNSKAKEHAYFMQQGMQWLMEPIIWQGAYNDYIAKAGRSKQQGDIHAAAVSHADSVLRTTQFPTEAENVAALERGSPFLRMMMQFMGYFNGLGNLNATELGNVVRESGWRSVARPKLWSVYMLGMGLPLFVAEWIARGMAGKDDDEDDDGSTADDLAKLFGWSQLRGGAAMATGLAPALNALMAGFTEQPWDDRLTVSPSIQVLERLAVRTPKAIGQLFDDSRPLTGGEVRDLYTFLAIVSGVPLAPIMRAHVYAEDMQSGRAQPDGTLEMLRGFVTGQPGATR